MKCTTVPSKLFFVKEIKEDRQMVVDFYNDGGWKWLS